ncbi:hypothetical protein PsYK624_114480 [Phanerochaete sordida]|uniref:Uncharacterized protein n=1 Tax=Phanerochaete sordida TaxID=48140 RepID=A0A9P3GKL9_9APHY|nr:hypothetical protein PsYK624_114480 [Phanerochaete sordida]
MCTSKGVSPALRPRDMSACDVGAYMSRTQYICFHPFPICHKGFGLPQTFVYVVLALSLVRWSHCARVEMRGLPCIAGHPHTFSYYCMNQ